MKLDRLILSNFLTFENLDYEFEQRPLLIQGENLTDDSQKTNGTGKSGLQTGIEFCITSSFSGYEQLVTYGKESGSAELYASCDVRKEEIHIHWDIRVKGSNRLNIKIQKYDENQWVDVTFSNINDGKKFIIDWFAISKEDISNYFIINNSRFKSFFKSSNKEKVDLINRFSDASIIEGLEKIDISELEDDLIQAGSKVDSTEGKIELLNEQILTSKGRDFKEEMKLEIEDLKDDIEQSDLAAGAEKVNIEREKANILDLEKDIVEFNTNIKEITKSISSIDLEINEVVTIIESVEAASQEALGDYNKFKVTDWDKEREVFEDNLDDREHELTDAKNTQTNREAQETTILKFLQEIEVKLSGAIICPKCDYEFLIECDIHSEKVKKENGLKLKEKIEKVKGPNNVTIALAKGVIKKIEDKLSDINKLEQAENVEKNKFSEKINSVTRKLNEVKALLNNFESSKDGKLAKIRMETLHIKTTNNTIKECESNIHIHKNNIHSLKESIVSYKLNIDNLKVGNNKEHINTLESSKDELEHTLVTQNKLVSSIGDKIYVKNQWMNNFKQFRMFLANKSLEVIEYHCNRYLTDMGSDLRVKMEGYKILASGKVKEEITAKIIRDTERTFNSFSGGERGRLLFASILANRQMINETHPYGGFDFLAVDEVFEGVDSLGLQSLINSIKSLGITVMIVTHVSDESESNDILTIVKENGISRIKK